MSEKPQQKHAPWWVYVIVVVGANLGRQQFMPEGTSWAVNAAATLVTIGVCIALVTVGYRFVAGRRTDS